MATLNISISDDAYAYIREQVARGAYRTPDEFVAALVRAERRRAAQADLEAKILEGLDSGPATEFTSQDWDEIRQIVHERAKRRKGA